MATTKNKVILVILILLALVIAISYDFGQIKYYIHSDVFWLGAMTGFFGCLFLVFLALIGYLVYKLKPK